MSLCSPFDVCPLVRAPVACRTLARSVLLPAHPKRAQRRRQPPTRRPGMISFQPRRHAVDEARRAAVRRVADWVEQALPEEERHTTHVMVNQVECREDGCPPMECVIALLRKPKIIFRVRPRHACIAMRCCPRPCTKGVHALTQRSLSSHGCCVVACAVLQARGRGDTGRGVDRAERHTARGKAIRSRPPRAPRARACRCA